MTAAIVGAAVGAAAVVLSDKDKRERLKQKAQDMLTKGEQKLGEVKMKTDSAKETAKEKLADNMRKGANKLEKTGTRQTREM